MKKPVQNTTQSVDAKRRYQTPELRRLGSFQEMTRTSFIVTPTNVSDQLTNTFYVS